MKKKQKRKSPEYKRNWFFKILAFILFVEKICEENWGINKRKGVMVAGITTPHVAPVFFQNF